MHRLAFKMKLFPGCKDVYIQRHDALWPELKELFLNKGVNNFSIFLDEETNVLFAYVEVDDVRMLEELPNEFIQQKWWAFMKDIMETNADNSPFQVALAPVFAVIK